MFLRLDVIFSDLVAASCWLLLLLTYSAVIFLTPFIIIVCTRKAFKTNARWQYYSLFAALPVGFTGIISGFLTGSSRSPAVGDLVPAIASFLGLLLIYFVGKNGGRAILAGLIALVFSANLFVGTYLGTKSRNRYEASIESLDSQKARVEVEFAIRRYRTSLGLPPDPPGQVTPKVDTSK